MADANQMAMLLSASDTVGKVGSQRAQARAVQAQGEYEAQAYERNADVAALQRKDAIERGSVAAGMKDAETVAKVGSARASMGAQGVDVGVGSAVDVQANISQIGALERATIENNAAREAWGFQVQGTDLAQRAKVARAAAKQAAAGLAAESIGTILTGASKTYGLYRNRTTTAGLTVPEGKVVQADWRDRA